MAKSKHDGREIEPFTQEDIDNLWAVAPEKMMKAVVKILEGYWPGLLGERGLRAFLAWREAGGNWPAEPATPPADAERRKGRRKK